MSLEPFGPKPGDHPSIGNPCAICKRPFVAGDYTTLVATGPGSEEDAEKMRAGRAYNAVAVEVCWSHADAITFFTGEEILAGEEISE